MNFFYVFLENVKHFISFLWEIFFIIFVSLIDLYFFVNTSAYEFYPKLLLNVYDILISNNLSSNFSTNTLFYIIYFCLRSGMYINEFFFSLFTHDIFFKIFIFVKTFLFSSLISIFNQTTLGSLIVSIKFLILIALLVFVRGGIPRYRFDYLTKLGWTKFLSLIIISFILELCLIWVI